MYRYLLSSTLVSFSLEEVTVMIENRRGNGLHQIVQLVVEFREEW